MGAKALKNHRWELSFFLFYGGHRGGPEEREGMKGEAEKGE